MHITPGSIEEKEPVVGIGVLTMFMRHQFKTSTSSPPGKPQAFDIFCALGVGNLTGKAFSGVGNFTFCLDVVGKIEP